MSEPFPWLVLASAWGGAPMRGVLRARPEDFFVDEILDFSPDGDGEHRLLQIEKRARTTVEVVRELARFAAIPQRDVGYAGMKDKLAVTRQWLTVRVAGPEPVWDEFGGDHCRILSVSPHRRKLRRGALSGNRFRIRVTALDGDRDRLAHTLAAIGEGGVPNYFGPQRFGRGGANVGAARNWLGAGGRAPRRREQRSMLMSAARSLIFNAVLDRRVADGSWARLVDGDLAGLDGSRSVFTPDLTDQTLAERLATLDIHPTGPLCGRGDSGVQGEALALETAVAAGHDALIAGLQRVGVDAARRQLRVAVRELEWEFGDAEVTLGFRLNSGAFATSVLREAIVDRPPVIVHEV